MKFKNMKRFGSIVMAGALTLSLAAPAFAADAETPANQTVVDGGYVATPISVIVPTTGSAQINPYGLPVVVSATADGDPISITNQQITNIPMYIGNYGTVALDVSATLAVLPKGDSVSIKGGDLATADTGKQMNVTLEVAGLDDAAYAESIDSEALVLSFHEAFAEDATWAGAQSLVAPAAAAKATTVPPAKSGSTPLATLGAATVSGDTITYGNDSVALFRLVGDMNEEPVKSVAGGGTEEDPWVEADGFTATIVFKFKPNTNANPPAGTGHNITEGTHTDASSDITSVTFKVGGNAVATADKDDTVTIEVIATTGKTITASVNGGSSISLTESSGTYTGTFTMPDADAEVVITVA